MAKNEIDSRVQTDAKDFEGKRAAFFEFAQTNFNDIWTDFNSSQFMVLIAELIAYDGDQLTYYLDKQTSENFLTAATLRQSVIDIGKMLDYRLRGPEIASGEAVFTLDSGLFDYGTPIPIGFQVSNGVLIYETSQEVTVPLAQLSITVPIIEGETIQETTIGEGALGVSDGSPNQAFTFFRKNVILANNLTDLGNDIEVKVDNVVYSPVFNLVTAQSSDQVYLVNTDENDETTITFGNGVFGSIPPTGAVIEATYRVVRTEREDNTFGNVNTNTITTVETQRDGVLSVTNNAKLSGGRDRESIAEARISIPKSVKAGDRAVSFEDFISIAESLSGIAKATALQGENDLDIDLYVAPEGGGFPSQALKNNVVLHFEPRKMIRTKVFPRDPIYQPVELDLRTQVSANTRNADVQAAQQTALEELFSFDNLQFGQGVFFKSTGGSDVFDINEALEAVSGAERIKYNKVTLKPFAYGKKFTNSGTPELLQNCCGPRLTAERREFEVIMKAIIPIRQFILKNKIIGESTSLNDTRLEDNLKTFLLHEGSSTNVGTSFLQDSTQFFQTDGFKHQTLIDVAGTHFEIISNTNDTFTFASGTPAEGDYQIVKRFVGHYVNPNINQGLEFLITANDANSVTVASGLSTVAVIGDEYEIFRYESNKFNGLEGTTAGSLPTETTFSDVTKGAFANDFFNGQMVLFQEGPAANIPVEVIDFVSGTGDFTTESFGTGIAPNLGDRYVVAPYFELGLKDVVSAIPTPTTTQFSGDSLGGEGNDFYNGYNLKFLDGINEGLSRRVTDYDDVSNDTLTTNDFPIVPATGDQFQLAKQYEIDDQSFTFAILATSPSPSDIYLFQGSELIGDLDPRQNQILTLAEEDIKITVVGGS